MTDSWATVIALSLAIGSASFMVTLTKVFVPLRVMIAKRSGNRFFKWLSELLQCPYCLGTWLSIFAVAIYRPRLVHEFLPLDLLVTVLVMNGVAMLAVLVIKKALSK